MQYFHAAIYTFAALVLLTSIGNVACRIVFSLADLKKPPSEKQTKEQAAGWIIGWLERLVFSVGIITHSWEVLAAVIALKTVARFKELDEQAFAEYFLVGSLFSILWAVVITIAWIIYDSLFGIDIQSQFVAILKIARN